MMSIDGKGALTLTETLKQRELPSYLCRAKTTARKFLTDTTDTSATLPFSRLIREVG